MIETLQKDEVGEEDQERCLKIYNKRVINAFPKISFSIVIKRSEYLLG
jgi:hypothetical protein